MRSALFLFISALTMLADGQIHSEPEPLTKSPYVCRNDQLPTLVPFDQAPGTIEQHSVVFTEIGTTWPTFRFRSLESSPIEALALVIEYTGQDGNTIDLVPLAAVNKATDHKFQPPFAVEGIQRWERALLPGSVVALGGVKNGMRTGVCPTQATVTFMMVQLSDGTVQTRSVPGWQLRAVPIYIPRAPEKVRGLPLGNFFDIFARIEVTAAGKVADVLSTDQNFLKVNWLREYMKENWTFHPALLNGQPTASEFEVLFRFPSTLTPKAHDTKPFLPPVTLIQFFPRRELYPKDKSTGSLVVAYGGLFEGSLVK